MQGHPCVCILGYEEPHNGFNPGVGSSCVPLQQVTVSFWDS